MPCHNAALSADWASKLNKILGLGIDTGFGPREDRGPFHVAPKLAEWVFRVATDKADVSVVGLGFGFMAGALRQGQRGAFHRGLFQASRQRG